MSVELNKLDNKDVLYPSLEAEIRSTEGNSSQGMDAGHAARIKQIYQNAEMYRLLALEAAKKGQKSLRNRVVSVFRGMGSFLSNVANRVANSVLRIFGWMKSQTAHLLKKIGIRR